MPCGHHSFRYFPGGKNSGRDRPYYQCKNCGDVSHYCIDKLENEEKAVGSMKH